MTQGDFTAEAWFKTTDAGRNILMGNYASNAGALNLELHTGNRARVYVSPAPGEDRLTREDKMDASMAKAAERILGERDPAAMFVYLHQVDAAGHTVGFHPDVPRYIEAIENADRHVGRVINGVRSRPDYERENWLFIVCTDHGGQGTRHGGGSQDPEILTVPIIVSGASARVGRIEEPAYIVDVVPTALAHLGIEIDPKWGLDGRPIGLRR